MVIEIKKEDSPEEISQKLKAFSNKAKDEKKVRLNKLFGSFKLDEDAVILQRRWRDEN